jgi:hypothetical protein
LVWKHNREILFGSPIYKWRDNNKTVVGIGCEEVKISILGPVVCICGDGLLIDRKFLEQLRHAALQRISCN